MIGCGGGRFFLFLNSEFCDEVVCVCIVVDYVIRLFSDFIIFVWFFFSRLKVFVWVSILSGCLLMWCMLMWCVKLCRLWNGWLLCVCMIRFIVLIFMFFSVLSV